MRLRVRESPVGGSRIAFSYLGTLAAALAASLLGVMVSPLAATVCRTTEDAACLLGWTYGSAILALLFGFALVAWVLRFGAEWWAVVAAFVVASPWWVDALPTPAVVAVAALVPAVAGAATLTGRRRPAWRPLVVGAAALALAAVGLASVLL